MASSDTKTGFRLPWSSDRSHDDPAPERPAETEPGGDEPASPNVAWPDSDLHARLGIHNNGQRPPDAEESEAVQAEESQRMVEIEASAPPSPVTPKKPSKLMADLSAAIRATAEAARDQALLQLDADARQITESIRERSTEGAATLRKRSDDDVAGIRDWSKAEIARIREETDTRIATRKTQLEGELSAHASAVDNRVDEVQGEVDRYRTEMAAYFERLANEDDPARLATMVEAMPEPPSFEFWADIEFVAAAAPAVEMPPVEAPVEGEAVADDEPAAFDEPATAGYEAVAEPETGEVDAVAETTDTTGTLETATEEAAAGGAPAGSEAHWGESDNDWSGGGATADAEPGDDVPRWEAGDAPEGFPTGTDEAGDPVDRGAIMAALEAAAEAVVAAEAAAESAETAEAAADVAETAAELLVGRQAEDGDLDPEAQAALAARVDAGGFEESYTDRLASLLPGTAEAGAGDEPRTTQVIVAGLVSVASIASFKRHLGRLAGVQAVAVASGPEGEFVFNVTHRADVSFRDAIPTMPGFAARVTGSGDGVVNVTARDPEAEG